MLPNTFATVILVSLSGLLGVNAQGCGTGCAGIVTGFPVTLFSDFTFCGGLSPEVCNQAVSAPSRLSHFCLTNLLDSALPSVRLATNVQIRFACVLEVVDDVQNLQCAGSVDRA